MTTLIAIQVNGQAVTVPPGQALTTCLEKLGYDLRLVAVEFNGEILHRQHWLRTSLGEGDVLEVVTIVGGGRLPSPPLQSPPGYSGRASLGNGWR